MTYATANLVFRRQFLLGPAASLPDFPGWKRTAIGTDLALATHPDLEVVQTVRGGRAITLLGFILDPEHPERDNGAVVGALIAPMGDFRGVLEATATLGGRWILVVQDGRDCVLFTDAGGLRQACYLVPQSPRSAEPWCASQSGLLAEVLDLPRDTEAVEFTASRDEGEFGIHWLPGDAALHEGVRVVLPNHYLDLRSRTTVRYWPAADLVPMPMQAAVAEAARLLRGLMQAAQRRFTLALSVTAGWDSRVMLALAREQFDELYIYTLTFPRLGVRSRDVTVPAALLKKLGGRHHLIRYRDQADPDFEALYRRNCPTSDKARCGDAQAMLGEYPQERVCISGDVGEVMKCYARQVGAGRAGFGVAEMVEFDAVGPHPFAQRAYAEWLSGANARNVDIRDLFSWEQMAGRIQALIRSQNDLVQESFAPFNCRRILVTMLSIDEEHRKPPRHEALRELIVELWPDVLREPINPRERKSARDRIGDTLAKLGIYQLIPRPVIDLAKRFIH